MFSSQVRAASLPYVKACSDNPLLSWYVYYCYIQVCAFDLWVFMVSVRCSWPTAFRGRHGLRSVSLPLQGRLFVCYTFGWRKHFFPILYIFELYPNWIYIHWSQHKDKLSSYFWYVDDAFILFNVDIKSLEILRKYFNITAQKLKTHSWNGKIERIAFCKLKHWGKR